MKKFLSRREVIKKYSSAALLLGVVDPLLSNAAHAMVCVGPGQSAASCSTTSTLLDQSGAWAADAFPIYEATSGVVGNITGNGKVLKSITLKTNATNSGSTSIQLYINTSLDFSGTNVGTASGTAPGTADTEFTINFVDGPTLTNSTTYYVAVFSSTAVYGTRIELTRVAQITSDYWSTNGGGLDGPFTGPNGIAGLWIKVTVCDN